MFSSLLNRVRSSRNEAALPTDVAIECVGHRWVISVRNPGQSDWRALRNPAKLITLRNHMDEEVKKIPAVHVFDTRQQAQDYVGKAIPEHRHVVRSAREISEFMNGITGVAQ